MNLNLKMHDIKDGLPLQEHKNNPVRGKFLVWGFWYEDEPRPYLRATLVQFDAKTCSWKYLSGASFLLSYKILYWAECPDFNISKDIEITKKVYIETEDIETEDIPQKIKDRIKNLDISKYIYKDPKETPKSIEKVMEYLDQETSVYEENIRYSPENYNFTSEEFNEVFKFLDHRNNKTTTIKDVFPMYIKFFQYKDIKFATLLMIGQGSHMEFICPEDVWFEQYDIWDDSLIYHIVI